MATGPMPALPSHHLLLLLLLLFPATAHGQSATLTRLTRKTPTATLAAVTRTLPTTPSSNPTPPPGPPVPTDSQPPQAGPCYFDSWAKVTDVTIKGTNCTEGGVVASGEECRATKEGYICDRGACFNGRWEPSQPMCVVNGQPVAVTVDIDVPSVEVSAFDKSAYQKAFEELVKGNRTVKGVEVIRGPQGSRVRVTVTDLSGVLTPNMLTDDVDRIVTDDRKKGLQGQLATAGFPPTKHVISANQIAPSPPPKPTPPPPVPGMKDDDDEFPWLLLFLALALLLALCLLLLCMYFRKRRRSEPNQSMISQDLSRSLSQSHAEGGVYEEGMTELREKSIKSFVTEPYEHTPSASPTGSRVSFRSQPSAVEMISLREVPVTPTAATEIGLSPYGQGLGRGNVVEFGNV